MEAPTEESGVQCQLLTSPLCSTPECSPVKSVGGHSEDNERDEDYIPPINLSFDENEDDLDGFENDQSKYSSFFLIAFLSLG